MTWPRSRRLGDLVDAVDRVHPGARGAVVEAAPSLSAHDVFQVTPWYLRLLVGAGAWIASISFLGCAGIFLGELFDAGSAFAGLFLMGLASILRRVPLPALARDAVHQSALALLFTGKGLLAMGIAEATRQPQAGALIFGVVEMAMVAAFVDPFQRVVATVSATFCLLFALLGERVEGWQLMVGLMTGVAVLARAAQGPLARSPVGGMVGPVVTGWTFVVCAMALSGDAWRWSGEDGEWSIAGRALEVVVAFAAVAYATVPGQPPRVTAWTTAALLPLIVATWWVPGVAAAAVLGLLAWRHHDAAALALCAATCALQGVFLYYSLELTFAVKAMAMAAPGAAMLLVHVATFLVPGEAAPQEGT